MTVKDMKARRGELTQEIRRLADTLQVEKRDFSDDERKRWDDVNAELAKLDRDIADAPDPSQDQLIGRGDYNGRDEQRRIEQDRRDGGPASWQVEADRRGVPRALGREERCTDYVLRRGGPGAEQLAELGVGRYFRAMALGAENEVEQRALSIGTDSAGGHTVPDVLSSQLIDAMRDIAAVTRAGARIVPLGSSEHAFARVASDPTPGWRAEAASITEQDPTFDRVVFEPKSLAMIIKVSRELLEDSINLNEALPGIIASSMAQEVDRASLFGSGSSNEPTGLESISGVNEEAHDAALTSYAPMISAVRKIYDANGPKPTSMILSPRDWETLAGLTDSNNNPLIVPPAIRDIQQLIASKMPTDGGTGDDESTIFLGDFVKFWLGVRTQMRVQTLTERYADTGQVAFLAWMRLDVNVEHASAFTKITGVQG